MMPICVSVPNFIKIGETVADIWRLNGFFFKMAAVRHLGLVWRVLGPPMVVFIVVQNLVGIKSPKTPIFWAWIGAFKPNGQNIESFILSKLLHRFQPNFAQRWRPSSGRRGWAQSAPSKSKMADDRHFEKTVKSPYLCNRLTDFDKIWYSDAYWPLTADLPLKFWIFENSRWRQNRDISAAVWPIFTKFGMLAQNGSLNGSDRWKIRLSQI